jgi:hypothetical protein
LTEFDFSAFCSLFSRCAVNGLIMQPSIATSCRTDLLTDLGVDSIKIYGLVLCLILKRYEIFKIIYYCRLFVLIFMMQIKSQTTALQCRQIILTPSPVSNLRSSAPKCGDLLTGTPLRQGINSQLPSLRYDVALVAVFWIHWLTTDKDQCLATTFELQVRSYQHRYVCTYEHTRIARWHIFAGLGTEQFGIFHAHLVFLRPFGIFFPVLVRYTRKNLATLTHTENNLK